MAPPDGEKDEAVRTIPEYDKNPNNSTFIRDITVRTPARFLSSLDSKYEAISLLRIIAKGSKHTCSYKTYQKGKEQRTRVRA